MVRRQPHGHPASMLVLILLTTASLQTARAQPAVSPIPKTYPIPTKLAAAETAGKPSLGLGPSLGRLGIVSAGALPFMVFYTDFAFDLGRFFANGLDVAYAPWPFKNQYSEAVDTSERFLRLGVSAGLSLAVGLVDLIVLSRR